MTYQGWIKSDEWKKIARNKLKQSGFQCELCGTGYNLQVHHITYEHIFAESEHMDDLAVLCKECHEQTEDHYDGHACEQQHVLIRKKVRECLGLRRNFLCEQVNVILDPVGSELHTALLTHGNDVKGIEEGPCYGDQEEHYKADDKGQKEQQSEKLSS